MCAISPSVPMYSIAGGMVLFNFMNYFSLM